MPEEHFKMLKEFDLVNILAFSLLQVKLSCTLIVSENFLYIFGRFSMQNPLCLPCFISPLHFLYSVFLLCFYLLIQSLFLCFQAASTLLSGRCTYDMSFRPLLVFVSTAVDEYSKYNANHNYYVPKGVYIKPNVY